MINYENTILPGGESSTKRSVYLALKNGDILTTLGALKRFNTIDLQRYICDLRKEGMPITDTWVTSENGKKHFKQYFLGK